MPISFSTLNNLPDVLGEFRHLWVFADVPGVATHLLQCYNSRVAFPDFAVGHIQVKVLGHSVGFAGGLQFENIISATFYENVQGAMVQSLLRWQARCRDPETGLSLPKRDYARNGTLALYDTAGKSVLEFATLNVFPVTIQVPEVSEQSGPAEVQVQFNVDALRLKGSSTNLTPAQAGEIARGDA